jgi:hypothetical protein
MAVSMEGGETAAYDTSSIVDVAQYRKPELFQSIQSLLSVRDAVVAIVCWAMLELVLIWVSMPLVFGGGVHWSLLVVLYLYASMAGAVAGGILGCARVVGKSLEDLLRVLDLSFELAQQAADDLGAVREGARSLPSARQLYMHVYEQAIMPTVKAVVLSQSRWLGRPVFWLYRVTLRWLVGRLVDRGSGDSNAHGPAFGRGVAHAEQFADAASGRVAVWRERLANTAEVLRRGVLVPLYAVVVLCEAATVVPLIVTWYVSG